MEIIKLKFDGQDSVIAEFKTLDQTKELYITRLNPNDPDMTKPRNVIGLIQRFKIDGYKVTLHVNSVDNSGDLKNMKRHLACGIGQMDEDCNSIQNRIMISALNVI